MDSSPICKNKSGSIIHGSDRRVIHNVFKYFKLWDFNMTVDSTVMKTASACGVSETTVYKIIKEQKETNTLKSPEKKRIRMSTIDKLDELDKCAIRSKVHSIYLNNDYPTLDKIIKLCESDGDIPTFKRTTLHKILHDLGFDFKKLDNRSLLIEREDIVLWRRNYLRKIKEYREANKTIYFLDEMWIKAGHVKTTAWLDISVKTETNACAEGSSTGSRIRATQGLSTGSKASISKGKILMALHIGSDKGFLEDGLLILEPESTKDDDDDEMNDERFLRWFKKILPKLDSGSVVVLDNAPYHCVKLESIPNNDWNKQQIIDWLQNKGLSINSTYLKKELLLKVAEISSQYNKYLVDEIAKNNSIEILRLPPYHCKLNPIEFVWAQVKNFIAINNSTFKISDVKKIFFDALSLIDANRWKKCCDYVIEEEKRMWSLDDIMEIAEQNCFPIKTEGGSSDTD